MNHDAVTGPADPIPLSVLIVEDSPADAARVEAELANAGYQLATRRVETATDLREALAAVVWDVIVADYSLPHFNALGVLQTTRELGLDIPVIVLSGAIGEELAVVIMRSGASDFVRKEHISRLPSVLVRAMAEANLRREQKRVAAELVENRIRLEASLAEKDALIRELHHRVKNNLQIVSSLLDLQADHVEGSQARAMLEKSRDRIKSMALVHESAYGSGDFARINIGEYLRSLVEGLHGRQVRHGVVAVVEAGDIFLDLEKALPCGLLVNELVANALDCAFVGRTEGRVVVDIVRRGRRVFLDVFDNGSGLPDAFSDIDHVPTLGLQLVATLTRQLAGVMVVDSSSAGTRFGLEFDD